MDIGAKTFRDFGFGAVIFIDVFEVVNYFLSEVGCTHWIKILKSIKKAALQGDFTKNYF